VACWFSARRLQLRGQPRLRANPHRIPYYSPKGTIESPHTGSLFDPSSALAHVGGDFRATCHSGYKSAGSMRKDGDETIPATHEDRTIVKRVDRSETVPFEIICEQPFLIARFPHECRTLGWSMSKPGFGRTSDVVWLEVRNADLTLEVDPYELLARRLASRQLDGAVAMMTSRDVRRHHFAKSEVDGVTAACLATVGLTNGESIGARRNLAAHVGTINTLLHVCRPLSDSAFVEAVSIVAEARTTAILDTAHLRHGPRITGTGTDCIVVAAPLGEPQAQCVGLHTAAGEAIGDAVYRAIREGAEEWAAEDAKENCADQA
jgi:adenosylcobinamide amidohydrolase